MFSPTKITLIGAVLFALQQTHYLSLQKHHLMLIYTVFIVVNKVSMVYLEQLVSDTVTLTMYIQGLQWFRYKARNFIFVYFFAYLD